MKLLIAIVCLCCSVPAGCASSPSKMLSPATEPVRTAAIAEVRDARLDSPAFERCAEACAATRHRDTEQGRCGGGF